MNQFLYYNFVSRCASSRRKIVIEFLFLSIAPMVELYHMVNHRHPLSNRYPAWQHSCVHSSHWASWEIAKHIS
jgi:hypothetical protein